MQWFWCILGFQVSWHFQPVLDKCGQIPRMQKDSFRISGSFGNFEFFDLSSKTRAPRVPSLPAPAMKLFWQGRYPECLGATDVLWVPTSIRCPVRSVGIARERWGLCSWTVHPRHAESNAPDAAIACHCSFLDCHGILSRRPLTTPSRPCRCDCEKRTKQ